MTAPIYAQVAVLATPQFRAAFTANHERVRGSDLRVYSVRIYIPTDHTYRTYNTLAWYHGPCQTKKRAKYASEVTIIRKGIEVKLKCCRNERLSTLAEFCQQKDITKCSRQTTTV